MGMPYGPNEFASSTASSEPGPPRGRTAGSSWPPASASKHGTTSAFPFFGEWIIVDSVSLAALCHRAVGTGSPPFGHRPANVLRVGPPRARAIALEVAIVGHILFAAAAWSRQPCVVEYLSTVPG